VAVVVGATALAPAGETADPLAMLLLLAGLLLVGLDRSDPCRAATEVGEL
jgi:hypothetical protein